MMQPYPYHLSLLHFPTVLILGWLSSDVLAQNTVAECGPSLLPLAPCAPFVQGTASTPAQSCCQNIDKLYSQKPTCLCLLLHDSSLSSSFPINTTLALQLPLFCNLQVDASICAGTSLPSPPSQVSFAAKPNSSAVPASPIVTMTPRSSLKGSRFHHSDEVRLKAQGHLLMLLLLAAISTVLTNYAEI